MLWCRNGYLNREALVTLRFPAAIAALLLLLLAACSTDRNVTGRGLTSGESFSGTASPGTFGGSLSLVSDRGTHCEGRSMSAESVGSTIVVLTCDDGRAGSVLLLDGPSQSVGTGVLGDEKVTLTITK